MVGNLLGPRLCSAISQFGSALRSFTQPPLPVCNLRSIPALASYVMAQTGENGESALGDKVGQQFSGELLLQPEEQIGLALHWDGEAATEFVS